MYKFNSSISAARVIYRFFEDSRNSRISRANFERIFVTAYSEYALRALKAEAVDYLIKPINIAELQKAVLRAEDRINKKKGRADVWHLLQHFDKRTYGIDKIAIPVGDGLDFVQIQQIIRLAAKGSYTQLFCTGCPPILSSRPLKEYECLLPAHQFFRAHHSHIINLSFIRHYHRGEGGYVTMSDGSVIDISKRKKKQFLELFLH